MSCESREEEGEGQTPSCHHEEGAGTGGFFAAGEGWEASEAVLQKGEGGETSSGMINTDLLKKCPQSL